MASKCYTKKTGWKLSLLPCRGVKDIRGWNIVGRVGMKVGSRNNVIKGTIVWGEKVGRGRDRKWEGKIREWVRRKINEKEEVIGNEKKIYIFWETRCLWEIGWDRMRKERNERWEREDQEREINYTGGDNGGGALLLQRTTCPAGPRWCHSMARHCVFFFRVFFIVFLYVCVCLSVCLWGCLSVLVSTCVRDFCLCVFLCIFLSI